MRHLSSAPLPALLSGLLVLALPALPAAAQMLDGPMSPTEAPAAPRAAQKEPPALPGLAGRPRPAPIPAEPGKNLSPNEALFDAINRGDLAAARDAMARGADLQARNVLGLTPLESSVDQGRSEITFFLLSSRPTVVTSAGPSGPASLAAPPAAARNMPLTAPPPSAMRSAPSAPARREVVSRPASATAYATAGATDGGAPRPDKGFLGFDASRPGR